MIMKHFKFNMFKKKLKKKKKYIVTETVAKHFSML